MYFKLVNLFQFCTLSSDHARHILNVVFTLFVSLLPCSWLK